MKKKTVAVIFGGCSPEYDVSIKSAYSIINAVNHDKYDVVLIGINRQGKWYRYTGDVENIPNDKWHSMKAELKTAIISPSRGEGLLVFNNSRVAGSVGNAVAVPIDVVFHVLHGKCGEDGTVQGLCELAGIPLVGSGSAASALCMDKDRSHKLVSLSGIRVPRTVCSESTKSDDELLNIAKGMKLPLFVKPVKTGSSFGISLVEKYSELQDAVRVAYTYDDAVIIEEGISGFEIGCAVVGNHELSTGRIDEIELSQGFFDYEEKYTLKTSKIHMPARIDEKTERRLQDMAMDIFRLLGCRGFARVDMFLTKEHEIVFNEVNTIPGFTPKSRFPSMMQGVGVDYPQLVGMLIELAQA